LAEDLIARTRRELQQRIAELEAMTAELPRLKAALDALSDSETVPAGRGRGRSRTSPSGGSRQRRPRGANREAILAVIRERPGVSVGEVAAVVEKQGVKKNVTYTTVNKLAKDGVIAKDDGALTVAASS
jgi:hypothetical protein